MTENIDNSSPVNETENQDPVIDNTPVETDQLSDKLNGLEPTGSEANNSNDSVNEFNLPDEYKDRPWAERIKSYDDLVKSYDNAQKLIGKKQIGIPDFEKASEEEIKDFYSKLAPESYEFGESIPEEQQEFYTKMFQENGINKQAGKKLVEQFMQEQSKYFDDSSLKEEFKTRFGDDYDKIASDSKSFFLKNLSKEDRDLVAQMPNKVLGAMFSFADNVKKSYGVTHTSNIQAERDSGQSTKADYQAKVMELINLDDKKQLTAQQKDARVKELNDLSKRTNWG